jgi:hypothetical protein
VRLNALIRVKTALPILIVATADYILVLGQHEHMLVSATNLDEVVF